MDTLKDYGAELPKTADMVTAQKVFKTKQRQVSNLFQGSISGRPVFNVEVPVGDGIYAAETILSRFGIPSIFVTANTDPVTRQRALAAGGLGLIEKPVTRDRLIAGLQAVT